MTTHRNPASCGSQILYDLHDVNDEQSLNNILRQRYQYWSDRRLGFDGVGTDHKIYKGETIIFSDADHRGRGKRLAKMIRQHKLGMVVGLRTTNPNTKNKITTWMWVYNGNKIKVKKNG